jgi:hypothetical protein
VVQINYWYLIKKVDKSENKEYYFLNKLIRIGVIMAKTEGNKKIVSVTPHKRAKPGGVYKKVEVKRHRRSTPNK